LFQYSVCPGYGNDERYGISKYFKAALFVLVETLLVFYRAGFLIMEIFVIESKFSFIFRYVVTVNELKRFFSIK
jgi:hypothetical protein